VESPSPWFFYFPKELRTGRGLFSGQCPPGACPRKRHPHLWGEKNGGKLPTLFGVGRGPGGWREDSATGDEILLSRGPKREENPGSLTEGGGQKIHVRSARGMPKQPRTEKFFQGFCKRANRLFRPFIPKVWRSGGTPLRSRLKDDRRSRPCYSPEGMLRRKGETSALNEEGGA